MCIRDSCTPCWPAKARSRRSVASSVWYLRPRARLWAKKSATAVARLSFMSESPLRRPERLTQRLDGDLGVDLGRAGRAVPDEVADGLQVEVRIDEALHRRVAQRVRPRPRDINARLQQVVAGPRRHRGGPDRLAGSRGPEEQVAIGRRGTSVLEIVQDGLADHGGERKRRGVAGFALGYRQPLTLPVDVVEGERGDFPAPQPTGTIAHRALGQPRGGTLDDERAQDRRRQLLDRLDTDPPQVRLEAVEVMTIAKHRGGAKATLLYQVAEEARHDIGEGLGVLRPAARFEASERNRQQLLD